MNSAYDAIPVTVNLSNISGTQTVGLNISEYWINLFTPDTFYKAHPEYPSPLSQYFSKIVLRSSLLYSLDFSSESADMLYNQPIVGISSMEAAPELDLSQGKIVTTLCPDADAHLFEIGDGCLISQEMSEQLDIRLDGTQSLTFHVYWAAGAGDTQTVALKVVGYYSGSGNSVYCSWNTLASIQDSLSGEIIADSLRAVVADNRQLDMVRNLLKEYFAEIDPSGKPQQRENSQFLSYYAFAASIQDSTFLSTTQGLSRSLSLLQRLAPVLLVLEVSISCILFFFAVRFQSADFLRMRLLGAPSTYILSAILCESVLEIIISISLSFLLILGFLHLPLQPLELILITASAFLGTLLCGLPLAFNHTLRK